MSINFHLVLKSNRPKSGVKLKHKQTIWLYYLGDIEWRPSKSCGDFGLAHITLTSEETKSRTLTDTSGNMRDTLQTIRRCSVCDVLVQIFIKSRPDTSLHRGNCLNAPGHCLGAPWNVPVRGLIQYFIEARGHWLIAPWNFPVSGLILHRGNCLHAPGHWLVAPWNVPVSGLMLH